MIQAKSLFGMLESHERLPRTIDEKQFAGYVLSALRGRDSLYLSSYSHFIGHTNSALYCDVVLEAPFEDREGNRFRGYTYRAAYSPDMEDRKTGFGQKEFMGNVLETLVERIKSLDHNEFSLQTKPHVAILGDGITVIN